MDGASPGDHSPKGRVSAPVLLPTSVSSTYSGLVKRVKPQTPQKGKKLGQLWGHFGVILQLQAASLRKKKAHETFNWKGVGGWAGRRNTFCGVRMATKSRKLKEATDVRRKPQSGVRQLSPLPQVRPYKRQFFSTGFFCLARQFSRRAIRDV